MKRKGLYILLAISITCALFSACNKNDSVEAVNVVEETTSIVESESVTEETETTTVEEIESTVEVVESTEEIETTTVEEVYITEQSTIDTTGKTNVVVQDGITYWDGITDEEIAQQVIDQFERENGIGKYAPGSDPSNYIMPEGAEHGTPGDPSKDYQGIRPLVDDPNGAGVKIN